MVNGKAKALLNKNYQPSTIHHPPSTNLDCHPIGNSRVLEHNYNATANVETILFALGFLDTFFVDNHHIGSDAGILIDDGTANRGISTDTDGDAACFCLSFAFGGGFVEVAGLDRTFRKSCKPLAAV